MYSCHCVESTNGAPRFVLDADKCRKLAVDMRNILVVMLLCVVCVVPCVHDEHPVCYVFPLKAEGIKTKWAGCWEVSRSPDLQPACLLR